MSHEIKAVVTDIEGTTTDLSFVKDVLFPYAVENLPDYVQENEDDISALLDAVKKEERNPELTLEEVIEVLLRYIEEDQKVTPLKELQGLIWEEGYKAGELKGHVYDDALECLKDWHKSGIKLYVYSSGSIHAQKLLFGNTEKGDLNGLFDGNFDTATGPKKEAESYTKIIAEIGFSAENILFLSDCVEEIDAAAKAGMNVVILDRESCLSGNQAHSVVQSFNQIFGDNQDHQIEASA